MNRKRVQRLIATSAMAAFTALSLATTTYAFVTLNTEATISEFGFDIVDQEGLLLSVDGERFYQDLDADLIRGAILSNNTATDYDEIKLTGVTLGGRDSSTDPYQEGKYLENYTNANNLADKKYSFIKDQVTWLDKYDVTQATEVASARLNPTIDNLFNDNDRVGVHSYDAATNGDYIFFDLWLRVINTSGNNPTYKLKFSNRTSITGTPEEVQLYNDLTTQDGTYSAPNKLEFNPADAMRLGLNVLEDNNNKLMVYEPNTGYGSYAIEGSTANETNPAKNAMYTYYNNLNPLTPFVKGVSDNGQLTTLKNNTSNQINDSEIAEFKYTNGSYNVVKLSVMVWLEGWDADYVVGINNNNIMVKLGFEIEEKN